MTPKNKRLSFAEIEKFRLPIYKKKGKDAYVYFYVLDPDSILQGEPKLKRIRKKFNHIHTKKERDEAALRFRDEISVKLRQGWNPLIEDSGKKSFAIYADVIKYYELFLKKLRKDNVLKEKTFIDYQSRLKQLREYSESELGKIVYIYQFDRVYIDSFLEHIYIGRDTTPRTRNNYLRWVSSFCTFLCDKGYLTTNPAEKIQTLRENDKSRTPLDASDMKMLGDYLQKHNPLFLLACQVQYYTLIRPGEMSHIRLKDISLKEQTIFVSKEVSKNRHDGKVTVPTKVLQLMIDLGTFNYPDNYYLFGRGFKPSATKADARIFREEWNKVREVLGFPVTYQFYSLKDTGITDTIDQVGLTIAKDQARHSSIETTNKYVRKDQLRAHPELKNFEGNL